jgi:hypothetical protein
MRAIFLHPAAAQFSFNEAPVKVEMPNPDGKSTAVAFGSKLIDIRAGNMAFEFQGGAVKLQR